MNVTKGTQWTNRIGAAATVLAAGVLLASLPGMAGAGSSTLVQPGPMPAPAPAPMAVADFPEHARVDAACFAILMTSSAVDNRRAHRAADITSGLLADACFGA